MTCYKDEKTGKWYCTFRYTDLTGKRVQKMKRGFALKRDAEKWERDFLSASVKDEIKVGKLIEEYEANLDYRVKTGSLKYSSASINKSTVHLYIKDYWKDVVVSKVKPKDITEWISDIFDKRDSGAAENCRYRKEHPHEPRTRLSSSTLNRAKNTLHAIFEFAVLNHGFTENPVERVKSLKHYSPDLRAKLWTLEQYESFRKVVKRQDMLVAFDIMIYAGLRIGEVLALTPADISEAKISISKSLTETQEHEIYIDTPKSNASTRIVEIPHFLYEEIEAFIKSNHGIKQTDILFNISRATIRAALNSGGRKVGNPPISPHILRHSYASLLLSVASITTVSNQLGHGDAATTMSVYSHMLPGADREAADELEKLVEKVHKK